MRTHIIQDEKVINTTDSDSLVHPDGLLMVLASANSDIGDLWDGAVFSKPPSNLVKEAANVRSNRDAKLAATDWTQVADVPVDQAAWATYRQSLRAMPEQAGFPNTIDWPTEP